MRDDDIDSPQPPRPRTINVLILLALVAAVFSYLGAFAVPNALLSVDLIDRWPPGHDPRPRWMILGFTAIIAIFAGIGFVFRISNRRHMKRIDAIADASP